MINRFMKDILLFVLIFSAHSGYGQVTLDADGLGNTYELITSVLAPNHNPIEVPDCNHMEFGEHIDEVFDSELNINVFRFHIHTTPDNDRCTNFDRQRNEIKAYDKSPDNLLGIENEKVVYKWKFKLASGFQSSPNFTHIHQLKSVGGSLASMPMYTLTTRKSNPDRIELRYAETTSQVTLEQSDLAPFIDTWVSVTETIKYGIDGTYKIEIRRVIDDEILLEYSNASIINWRSGAEFVRPKWGIYRSLINDQDLRDEAVLFANFSVEELDVLSSENEELDDAKIIFSNPFTKAIEIKKSPKEIDHVRIFKLDGTKVLEQSVNSKMNINLNVSHLPSGSYVVNIKGKSLNRSKLVVVY